MKKKWSHLKSGLRSVFDFFLLGRGHDFSLCLTGDKGFYFSSSNIYIAPWIIFLRSFYFQSAFFNFLNGKFPVALGFSALSLEGCRSRAWDLKIFQLDTRENCWGIKGSKDFGKSEEPSHFWTSSLTLELFFKLYSYREEDGSLILLLNEEKGSSIRDSELSTLSIPQFTSCSGNQTRREQQAVVQASTELGNWGSYSFSLLY